MDLDLCLATLIDKKQFLPEKTVEQLCRRLKEVLIEESNVVHIQSVRRCMFFYAQIKQVTQTKMCNIAGYGGRRCARSIL